MVGFEFSDGAIDEFVVSWNEAWHLLVDAGIENVVAAPVRRFEEVADFDRDRSGGKIEVDFLNGHPRYGCFFSTARTVAVSSRASTSSFL